MSPGTRTSQALAVGGEVLNDQQGQGPAAAAIVPGELGDVGLQAVIRLLDVVRHHTATAS
ncbi:hypothetical protein ACH4FX_33010 [Streptomyces sp. NPDC018019]|uniref:hypothetical protein n=1 Tax=Streptomyces sp. NPDC018019 TaxID=3365030 RepID=UPI003798C302